MSKKLSQPNCKSADSLKISIPIGILKVSSCEEGIHSLSFEKFQISFSKEVQTPTEKKFRPDSLPKICWKGICKPNTFSERVLKTLLNQVHFGQTISYKNLASLSGNERSQRAVGTVMRRNPICLLIPCHRVINSNNKIGNYTGGVEIKKWLLDFESEKGEYF
ncbi:unnamed protein product [Brachionus calyciflorus]|uniref:Methylated-DNA--protein-cysteine methyltransferase n=1 Tax=Brachionus calyciflorus TaxID=104777 RepID=A0A813NYG3_9BILA|nr:unnamed protein product [Brachionus calyciflorus]